MTALCRCCGEEILPAKRAALGIDTCLECGEIEAQAEAERRKSQVAPLYNKGAYQYITSPGQAKDFGRK